MQGRSCRFASGLLAAAAVSVAVVPAAEAAPHKPWVSVERAVPSASPDARQVKESYVRLRSRLPKSAGPRPSACDWIGYLRFRDASGPQHAWKADAIFVTMPGIFAGASSLDVFARNMVRTARASGRHVEVWTVDRRSNCLEDHYGTQQAARAHDYRTALNYYYHGAAVHGRRFGGYKSPQDAEFLKAVGLEQTVRDEYTVIRRMVPRKLRTKKVFCGGHSLGGPLTTAFADWDFDGNPKTTSDAGYKQCAGFFALDTRLNLGNPGSGGSSSGGGGGGSSSVGLAGAFAQASGGSPYINAPPFTPETIQAVPPTALAAFQAPRATPTPRGPTRSPTSPSSPARSTRRPPTSPSSTSRRAYSPTRRTPAAVTGAAPSRTCATTGFPSTRSSTPTPSTESRRATARPQGPRTQRPDHPARLQPQRRGAGGPAPETRKAPGRGGGALKSTAA